MGLYLESFLLELVLAIVFIDLLILLYFYRSFSYWNRKQIPYVKPTFPFGNISELFFRKKSIGEVFKDIYDELKRRGVKYGGFYMLTKKVFMPVDLDLVKQIMIKDFPVFQDRGVFVDEDTDPLSAHLFSIEGQKWKNLRKKLSPTFTSGKMKMMFHTFVATGETFKNVLREKARTGEPIDIKDFIARYTTDIIASCAFGLECNSLENPNADFRVVGRRMFEHDITEGLKNIIGLVLPDILKYLKIPVSKPDVTRFFLETISQTVEYREKNNIERNDMLNLLIKMKNSQSLDEKSSNGVANGKVDESITFNELAAQCFVFFAGGFETSSTTVTFLFYELCQHQEIQDKLREEIRTVLAKHKGQVTYEALMEMEYMDKVVNESLRKYPPLPFLNRICGEDWRIPGTDKILEKGTSVIIAALGIQMDPEYFPDPEKFDPERFSDEGKAKRPGLTHLPFGDGPRNCIGMRFGFMQVKVGLTYLLKNHKFTLDPKTKPIVFDVDSVIMAHRDGIWLQSEEVM